jgi:hypothetical protein
MVSFLVVSDVFRIVKKFAHPFASRTIWPFPQLLLSITQPLMIQDIWKCKASSINVNQKPSISYDGMDVFGANIAEKMAEKRNMVKLKTDYLIKKIA